MFYPAHAWFQEELSTPTPVLDNTMYPQQPYFLLGQSTQASPLSLASGCASTVLILDAGSRSCALLHATSVPGVAPGMLVFKPFSGGLQANQRRCFMCSRHRLALTPDRIL